MSSGKSIIKKYVESKEGAIRSFFSCLGCEVSGIKWRIQTTVDTEGDEDDDVVDSVGVNLAFSKLDIEAVREGLFEGGTTTPEPMLNFDNEMGRGSAFFEVESEMYALAFDDCPEVESDDLEDLFEYFKPNAEYQRVTGEFKDL